MAFPWALAIPAGLSLLGSSGLFGETQTQKQRRMMEELLEMLKPRQEYMWERFKEIDPQVLQAIQAQMSRTQGWGWPGGMTGGGV